MGLPMDYFTSVRREFLRYKSLGENTFAQLTDSELYWKPSPTSNSAAIIATHMAGNMISRWTRVLEEDGEKSWRNREGEFTDPPPTREALLAYWEKGWGCLFEALELLERAPEGTLLHIRGEAHTPAEAINRQLAHYASHAGQLVFLGKILKGESWRYLSIPPGQSEAFNRQMLRGTPPDKEA
ncbi:DUF1572 family protein [Robiginitalea sediminis]|uniref:DUF1572 family protein n=1 Tax=Robiginitalea sediminis TaxID=1982593 RepID=UPI000B4B182F|nr:DUF1572 family protein [Robiginitalea sediminis]